MKAYEFDRFKDFFEFQLKEKVIDQNGKKTATLNELANRMGYNSASSLSMIASGTRLPSKALLRALFNEWDIHPSEQERILLKVEIEKRQRKDKNSFHLISQLNRLSPYHKIDIRTFSLFREWYVLVIKILAEAPDFCEDPIVISQKLRKKISPSQAKKALTLLQETGLLMRNPTSGTLHVAETNTDMSSDIPSEAIRENHRGMLQRAIESIDEQSMNQRVLNAMSLQFNPKDLAEAQADIMSFVKTFNEKYNSNQSTQIYQLNVQLFELTNGGSKNDQSPTQ